MVQTSRLCPRCASPGALGGRTKSELSSGVCSCSCECFSAHCGRILCCCSSRSSAGRGRGEGKQSSLIPRTLRTDGRLCDGHRTLPKNTIDRMRAKRAGFLSTLSSCCLRIEVGRQKQASRLFCRASECERNAWIDCALAGCRRSGGGRLGDGCSCRRARRRRGLARRSRRRRLFRRRRRRRFGGLRHWLRRGLRLHRSLLLPLRCFRSWVDRMRLVHLQFSAVRSSQALGQPACARQRGRDGTAVWDPHFARARLVELRRFPASSRALEPRLPIPAGRRILRAQAARGRPSTAAATWTRSRQTAAQRSVPPCAPLAADALEVLLKALLVVAVLVAAERAVEAVQFLRRLARLPAQVAYFPFDGGVYVVVVHDWSGPTVVS